MNPIKVGQLICQLRKEKGWTQKQLAEQLGLCAKTISKWETGNGSPDLSVWRALADVLQVSVKDLLSGELSENEQYGGNMKKIQFYICPQCGNVITATANSEISCCGKQLTACQAQPIDTAHTVQVEEIENDYYLTWQHPMHKTHHIQFAAYVIYDRVLLMRLYPEQESALRFPRMQRGLLYFYCSQDGLFQMKL